MMNIFRLPSPLSLAAEQLEQARRDLLAQEAAAEAHLAQASAHKAQVAMLVGRISRLRDHASQLKEQNDG